MISTSPSRSRLLAPLIQLAALVLLLEDWFWDLGARLAGVLERWAPLRALEERVSALPPYPALCLFVLPGLLLLPVKLLAVVAIARGHAMAGIATIVLAKVGGAAVVARVYVLTLPNLRRLGWFARLHNWFIAAKTSLISRLRASRGYRQARWQMRKLRRKLRFGGRRAGYTSRILRRFVALWRARRRKSTRTEQE
ncbi:hypothetical protein [Massilia horti]|uniref:Transmembrane protein n=1 Tax=Massilia horti TaxID=2562153 RepID=A0A4Y9SSQ5_9BURK|nr:hypothetical protein [Massilia horti]TFW29515.1 hypothetical protein E4O92_18385 [Massilia horti]